MLNYNPDWCKWEYDPEGIERTAAEEGQLDGYASHLYGTEKKDTFLWVPFRKVYPQWNLGRENRQKIGSCVAFGACNAVNMLMGIQHFADNVKFEAVASTEAAYGGCRVEALGRRTHSWSDGAFGYAAAKWVNQWGVLLRQDYSIETGNREHDLRVYDSKKEKNWGYYGCGGQNDKGKLDEIARRMPVKEIKQVKSLEEAEAAILNWYPITIASMAGFGNMRRDSRGIVRRSGRWPHQMVLIGIRYLNGQRHWRILQSWGHSCSGPDPGINDDIISACSWWATDADVAWILRSGDCWALSDVAGMPKRELDLASIVAKFEGHEGGSPYV